MNYAISLLLFLCMLPIYANAEPPSFPDPEYSRMERVTLHANNNQLNEQMDRLDSLMQERFLTEPELDAERHKYAKRIAKMAQNLSQTLDAILITLPTLKLEKSEEATFQTLIEKLHAHVKTLQKQANQNRMDTIPNTLEQINTTCVSCHILFKNYNVRKSE